MTFPVGKLGGIFDDISDARGFAGRQLDTVIDVSGSAKNFLMPDDKNWGFRPTPKPTISESPLKSVSPIVWVGLAAIVAYFAIGKK